MSSLYPVPMSMPRKWHGNTFAEASPYGLNYLSPRETIDASAYFLTFDSIPFPRSSTIRSIVLTALSALIHGS